jgi:hypothetical protein
MLTLIFLEFSIFYILLLFPFVLFRHVKLYYFLTCSSLFCFILAYSIIFYFILFCSILRYYSLFFCFILPYSALVFILFSLVYIMVIAIPANIRVNVRYEISNTRDSDFIRMLVILAIRICLCPTGTDLVIYSGEIPRFKKNLFYIFQYNDINIIQHNNSVS